MPLSAFGRERTYANETNDKYNSVMELINNYLVRISKSEYSTNVSNSMTPDCNINSSELSFYSANSLSLYVNPNLSRSKTQTNINRQSIPNTKTKQNVGFSHQHSFSQPVAAAVKKEPTQAKAGTRLLKRRFTVLNNPPTQPHYTNVPSTSTTPTPIVKSLSTSQLSMASTSKIHVSVPVDNQSKQHHVIDETEARLQAQQDQELQSNVHRLINTVNNHKTYTKYAYRNHTVINFNFMQLGNNSNNSSSNNNTNSNSNSNNNSTNSSANNKAKTESNSAAENGRR